MAFKNTVDSLPAARYRHAAVGHKNRLYVAGGATDYAAVTTIPLTVLSTRVDAGGESSGPWVECAPRFTKGKIGAQMLMVGNENLMVLGGRGPTATAADVLPAQDIYVGKLDADGLVPSWTLLAGALPVPMVDFGVVVHDDWMFVLGGSALTTTLAYKTQGGVNFTVGQVVTGTVSSVGALIAADTDAGATGSLR